MEYEERNTKNMEAYQNLKNYLTDLSKRVDLDVYKFEIGEPVNLETLAQYKGKLPEDLLNFYSVMNGCEFKAWFNDKYEDTIGIRILPLESIGKFFKAENTDEYNFKTGVSFLEFENWMSDRPSFFIVDNNDTTIITAWAGKENEPQQKFYFLSEFVAKCIKNCLVYSGICDPKKDRHFLTTQKRVAKKLVKPAKAPIPYLKDDRIEHPFLGKGKIITVINTGKVIEYYHPVWLLVHFYISDTQIWVQKSTVRKLAKKVEHTEKTLISPNDFFEYLEKSSVQEQTMLLSILCWGHRSRITNGNITIPSSSKIYYGVFQHIPLNAFLGWSLRFLTSLNTDNIKSNFFAYNQFVPKKGMFAIPKIDLDWQYQDVTLTLIGTLIIRLTEYKEGELPAESSLIVDEIVSVAESILTDLELEERENYYEIFSSMIKFLKEKQFNLENMFISKGSQIKDPVLINAGLEGKYHTQ